jgi:probable HAF family extracellular repeat protein
MDAQATPGRRMVLLIACLAFIAGSSASTAAYAQKYSVSVLQLLPGGTFTSGAALNNAGQVAGQADDGTPDPFSGTPNSGPYGVIWNHGIPTNIAGSAVFSANASGINNSGFVVGTWEQTGLFVWSADSFDFNDDSHSVGIGINDSGEIVGEVFGRPWVWANRSDLPNGPSGGLPLLSGDFDLAASPTGINNSGQIVGVSYSESSNATHATRWSNGGVTDLGTLGGASSYASAINGKGWIVGWAALGNNLQHAALWEPTTRAYDLGTLGGKNSNASGINIEGDIAGSAQNKFGVWHAVLWTHKHFQIIDLNAEISPALAKTITLTGAAATNDRCMVLADGYDNASGLARTYVLTLADQSDCNED